MTRDSLAKVNVSIGILLSVLALILAACGDSAENTTVDEVSDATDNTPGASAQEVTQNACNSLEAAKYYDIAFRSTETAVDDPTDVHTWVSTTHVAEDDYHSIVTAEGTNRRYEKMRVENILYVLRSDRGETEWKISDHKYTGPVFPFTNDSLCPDVEALDLRKVGDEQLDGVAVKRYTDKPDDNPVTLDVDESFRGYTEIIVTDLLIDSEGQLVKMEQDGILLYQSDEGTISSTLKIESLISGVGEVNVIEAPAVGTRKSDDK